jgi:hypothetical protein
MKTQFVPIVVVGVGLVSLNVRVGPNRSGSAQRGEPALGAKRTPADRRALIPIEQGTP